jgi:hypothetical protein
MPETGNNRKDLLPELIEERSEAFRKLPSFILPDKEIPSTTIDGSLIVTSGSDFDKRSLAAAGEDG